MITLELKGIDKILNIADKFPAASEIHINKAITRSLIRIQDQAKQNAPFGTSGNLRANWILGKGRFEGSLKSGANNNGFPYGSAVEYGTRPHTPPTQALSLWAIRRGLNPFVIARSIARKGTKANPFFKKSVDSQEQAIDNEFSRALDNILKEI